jgi:hypothetical protein
MAQGSDTDTAGSATCSVSSGVPGVFQRQNLVGSVMPETALAARQPGGTQPPSGRRARAWPFAAQIRNLLAASTLFALARRLAGVHLVARDGVS